MRKEKIDVGTIVRVNFIGVVNYYDAGGSETYGINPIYESEQNGKYFNGYRVVSNIQPEWVTIAPDVCLHDFHVTTTDGMVLGQKVKDGSAWQVCEEKNRIWDEE